MPKVGGVNSIQPLVVVALATSAGIVIDRCSPMPWLFWSMAASATWFFWLILWWFDKPRLAALFLLLCITSTGGAWHHYRWNFFAVDELGIRARHSPQAVCFEGIALTGPRSIPPPRPNPLQAMIRGEQSRLKVRVTGVRNRDRWESASGKLQLFVDGQLHGIGAGDQLRIFSQFLNPKPAQNPGEFDLWLHQRADRILCRAYANHPDCVVVQQKRSKIGILPLMDSLRSYCSRMLWKHLSHERSGLAAAVLLGAREQINSERIEAFVVTGTVHLFAISGLHVGIMAAGLFFVARLGFLPRQWSLWLVFSLVVLYTMLTEARPPVVRAATLVSVMCLALSLRRPVSKFNSLAAAVIVLLVVNPADLFRTGAQLSCLAVATLYWFMPGWHPPREVDPFDQLLEKSRSSLFRLLRRGGREIWLWVRASAMIWLIALPLIMYHFHIFSPVAILLNTVLWLPMLVVLYSGFGLLVIGWIFPPLAKALAYLCDANLWFLETVVNFVKEIDGSHFWVPGPASWWLLGFYGGLGLMAVLPRLRPPLRWIAILLIIWISLGWTTSYWSRLRANDEQSLSCTFLSVGHGTSVVIEMPNGKIILYDAGTLGVPMAGTHIVSSFLWSRGIRHIDGVVLSHADVDHYNALPGLLERFHVDTILCSPQMFNKQDPALTRLASAIEQNTIPIDTIMAGNRLSPDHDVTVEILHPPPEGVIGSDNANSIVLCVEYHGWRILLPGDLEPPGLGAVIAEPPRTYDIVMAPHHGSIHSDPEMFAKWCQAKWVIISSGNRHNVRPVVEIYQKHGAQVLQTVNSGAIRVTINAEELTVRRWRQEGW